MISKLRLSFIAGTFGFMAFMPPQSHAEVKALAKADVQKAVDRVRQDLQNQTLEYEKTLKTLQKINKEMKRFVEERSNLDQERILTEAQIKTIADKIRILEGNMSSERVKLLLKIQSLHRFNEEAWLGFLMKAQNSAQLERNMKILGLIGGRDIQAMKDYSRLVRDLAKQKNQFTDRLAYLSGLQTKISEMEKSLKEQTDARSEILANLKEKQKSTVAKLRKLQERQSSQGSKLAENGLLDALLASSFLDKKGQLEHPLAGPLTQNYGVIRDNDNHLILSHRGWMYEGPRGSAVRNVFDGQVAHIGHFPEYGTYTVIDHGDHFYTVYAMLESVSVKVGDTLKEGQTVGQAGMNPFDGRTGLYFEIRHFAETVDPKPWMKGRVYEISNLEVDH